MQRTPPTTFELATLGFPPWLATNNLVEYARRMSVSVAALAVSLAMTVAIAVLIGETLFGLRLRP